MMATDLAVRVTVLECWDEVTLEATPETAVGEVKRRALQATRVAGQPGDYLVKYLGARLADDDTLGAAGVLPNGALIVIRRRRQPTR